MECYISKFESLGTLDGPGVRAIVFTSGCPFKCIYCHNPETQSATDGTVMTDEQLYAKIKRIYPYIKNGGVTFSGGEPCLNAPFLTSLARMLKNDGVHIALDTSGGVMNSGVKELINLCDLVLLDVKFTDENDYKRYTGGSLRATIEFLEYLYSIGKPVWIRHVVVPGINDSEDDVLKLRELVMPYKNVQRVELLPFKKLCVPKYESLKRPFLLNGTPEMDTKRIDELERLLNMD